LAEVKIFNSNTGTAVGCRGHCDAGYW